MSKKVNLDSIKYEMDIVTNPKGSKINFKVKNIIMTVYWNEEVHNGVGRIKEEKIKINNPYLNDYLQLLELAFDAKLSN